MFHGIWVKSPSAKSPPGKLNASQIIAHQLNAVWSQVAASRYERHYDVDKCIIVRRKRLYYAVVTSKYIYWGSFTLDMCDKVPARR